MPLNYEQKHALGLALTTSDPLFITGSAGTGKTVALKTIVEALRESGRKVKCAAYTGLAALQLGGSTLARTLGLGTAKGLEDMDLDSPAIDRAAENLDGVTDLTIDEISMNSGDYLQLVDVVMQEAMGNELPFGGIRIIYSGDFLQLPPIQGIRDRKLRRKWAFQYPPFKEAQVVQLTQSQRQGRGVDVRLLNEIRVGEISPLARQFMRAAVGRRLENPTELHPLNAPVLEINRRKLQNLPGPERAYQVTYDSSWSRKFFENSLPVEPQITLKVGAPVIVVANREEAGYFNGTQGVVTHLQERRVGIRTTEHRLLWIYPHEWKGEPEGRQWSYADRGVARGIPLKLGWAATIHKSQGLTLQRIRADLSRCWEPGHLYVALSRVRDLRNVSLVKPFNQVRVDPHAVEFVRSLG